MNKTIKIGGLEYSLTDPRLCTDYFTKEVLIKNNAVHLGASINLTRSGYEGTVESAYIAPQTLAEKLTDKSVKMLRSRHGDVYILADVITIGEGLLHPSVEDNGIDMVFDDYTNVRMNIRNKFRSFNNQVKAFTDLSNSLIPDSDKKAMIERNYTFGVDSATFKITEGHNYTFGVELETSSGRLSEADVQGLNLKCEFDGSLRETPDQRREDVLGGEYITGVLKGDKGFFQLQKVCNKLSDRCTINSKGGVHVHIGGIALNKENIVFLYKLGELLQDEIGQMMPASRRNNAYCRKITAVTQDLNTIGYNTSPLNYEIVIEEIYNKIFKEVSHTKAQPDRQHNKESNHPMGSKCGYDKATQRYCWLNFVTAIFNTKGSKNAMTLEFRNHSASLNYKKIKNWVKICMGFVAFAENHKASILRGYWEDSEGTKHPINLAIVMEAVYPRSSKIINSYIDERKSKFLLDSGAIEEQEYKTDKEGIKILTLKEDIQCV